MIAPARRPRPVRALLWKEWRQQRWLALLLCPAPALLYAALFATDDLMAVLGAIVMLCTLAVVIGANAFCGETDQNTADFCMSLPASRATAFWMKYLSATGFAVLALALLAVLALVWSGEERPTFGPDSVGAGLLALAVLVLVLLPLTAFASVLVRHTIECILLTFPMVAGALACAWATLWIADNVSRASWQGHEVHWALAILLWTAPLIGARWLWCWSRVPRRRTLRLQVFVLAIAVFLMFMLWFAAVIPLLDLAP